MSEVLFSISFKCFCSVFCYFHLNVPGARCVRAEGPSADSSAQTGSAVGEIIMRVADLLVVLNNGPDPGGALAVLSL